MTEAPPSKFRCRRVSGILVGFQRGQLLKQIGPLFRRNFCSDCRSNRGGSFRIVGKRCPTCPSIGLYLVDRMFNVGVH